MAEPRTPAGGASQAQTGGDGGFVVDEGGATALDPTAPQAGQSLEDWIKKNGRVYSYSRPRPSDSYVSHYVNEGDHGSMSYMEAADIINTLRAQKNPRDYKMVVNSLKAAGYLQSKATVSAVQSAWNDLVLDAAERYKQGEPINPFVLLNERAYDKHGNPRNWLGDGPAEIPYDGPITTTSSNTQVATDLTNKSTAKAAITSAFKEALGREPTLDEVERFHQALNSREKRNPVVQNDTSTTTVTQGDRSKGGDGQDTQTSSDSTRKGGVNPAQVAEDYAQSQPDYAEYQTATTYMDAFLNTMRGVTL